MSSETLIDIAKFEVESLTDFQKEIHFNNDDNPDEVIPSKWSYNVRKTTWSAPYTEKMNAVVRETQGKRGVYEFNKKFHYVTKIYGTMKIRHIEVKEKYKDRVKIAMCNNLTHNIFKEIRLEGDNGCLQKEMTISLDNNLQFDEMPGHGKRKLRKLMTGDRSIYGQWTSSLPALKYQIILPFDFTKHKKKAIPLFKMNPGSTLQINILLETELSKLIMMKIKTREGWKITPYNSNYLVDIKENETIKFPDLWAIYHYITPEEVKWRKSFDYEVYIQDILVNESVTVKKFGDPETLDLYSSHPVIYMRWGALNIDAKKLNINSNYSSSTEDIDGGFNPVKKFALRRGNSYRINKLDHIHFSRLEPYHNTMSAPYDEGYNHYNLTGNIYNIYPDGGVTFNSPEKITAELYIDNTNPSRLNNKDNGVLEDEDGYIIDENIDISKNSPKFRPYVLLGIVKKIIYSNGTILTDTNIDEKQRIMDQHYESK